MNFTVSDGEFTDSQEVLIDVNMVDVEVGLSYFGARFYDPETARFLTADTYTNLPNDERILSGWSDNDQILQIGFIDSQLYNQYSYCQNNPINRVDPDGHFSITLGITIAVTISPTAVIAAKTAIAAAVGALIGKAIVDARKETIVDSTSLPMKGKPNSTAYKYGKNGEVIQERHYDENGDPDYDVDHSDHGNPKTHTNPHKHKWKNGEREPGKPLDSSGNSTSNPSRSQSGSLSESSTSKSNL